MSYCGYSVIHERMTTRIPMGGHYHNFRSYEDRWLEPDFPDDVDDEESEVEDDDERSIYSSGTAEDDATRNRPAEGTTRSIMVKLPSVCDSL